MGKRICKVLAVILSICLALGSISVMAAETKGEVEVSDVAGKPGENIEIPVILKSNPGIVSLYLAIEYNPEVLKLNSVKNTELLPDYMPGSLENNPFAISWELASATKNDESTGTLAILNFSVSEDAEPGEYEIIVGQYGNNTPYDIDLNDVEFVYQSGRVTVEAPTHNHVFGQWNETEKVTCTTEGKEERICTVKGCEEKEIRAIPALGHNYSEWETVVEATIINVGREERTCSRCGNVESREIPKIQHGEKDHIFNGRQEVLIEADCTHEGKVRVYCSVDGCDAYQDKIIEALGHASGEWKVIKNPTCTEFGLKEKRCTTCQEKLGEETLNALGHSFGEWAIIEEPAIGSEGLRTRECAVCGEIEKQTIPAINHGESDHIFNGKEEVISEATCTETGTLRIYCSFKGCDAYIDTGIPAKGHKEGEWITKINASCVDNGLKVKYCTVCNQKIVEDIIPAYGHINGEWQVVKEPDCTNNGLKEQYCTVCNVKCSEEIVPSLGHDYDEWKVVTEASINKDGLEESICKRCKNKETRIIPKIVHEESDHIFNGKTEIIKEADCENDGVLRVYCSFDGCIAYQDSAIPATGHTLGEWKIVKEPMCTEEGEKEVTCTICGNLIQTAVIPAKGHIYGDWEIVKEATFVETGLQERTCEVCEDKLQAIIPKLSESHVHDFSGEPIAVKEATCTEKGQATITCSYPECNETKEVEIAAKGHSFGEWTVIKGAAIGVEGIKESQCTVCGVIKHEKIPALKNVDEKVQNAVRTGDDEKFGVVLFMMILAIAILSGMVVVRRTMSFR